MGAVCNKENPVDKRLTFCIAVVLAVIIDGYYLEWSTLKGVVEAFRGFYS